MSLFKRVTLLFTFFMIIAAPGAALAEDSGQGVIFYSVTYHKVFKPDLRWAPYDLTSQAMLSKKNKGKKINTDAGKSLFKEKNGDLVKEYFFRSLDAGTYVLHSVKSGNSLTSYFPVTAGFTIAPGEVLFIGDFNLEQLVNRYRANIDGRTGLTLVLSNTDPAQFKPPSGALKEKGLTGKFGRMTGRDLIYYPVEDYYRGETEGETEDE